MSEDRQWISQSDIDARMRLLRYGIIVAVVVIFLVTWLVPFVFLQPYTSELEDTADIARDTNPEVPEVDKFEITDSLLWGLAAGVATAVAGVILYFVYREILNRTIGEKSGGGED
jgi:hypothetical protein